MDACPTGALTFGEESELKDLIAKAEVLKPEAGAKPRVYYIDLPNKYFIAGEVFDPEDDECLEGAKVTLTRRARAKRSRSLPPTTSATSGSSAKSRACTRCAWRRRAMSPRLSKRSTRQRT